MRCRRCGSELNEDNVCSQCGAQAAQPFLSVKNIACCMSCAAALFFVVFAVIVAVKFGVLPWFNENLQDAPKVAQSISETKQETPEAKPEAKSDANSETNSEVSADPEVRAKFVKEARYITFGSYPQSGGSRAEREPIEWLILESDDKQAFVLSKYALDCLPFNNIKVATNWRDCDLRRWLNKDFFYKAFNDAERKRILDSEIETTENDFFHTQGCGKTVDKIFCLSLREAHLYFGDDTRKWDEAFSCDISSNKHRACQPTMYAKMQGAGTPAYSSEFKDFFGVSPTVSSAWWFDNCFYWLRSPGRLPHCAPDVNLCGGLGVGGNDVDSDYIAVRPAMRIILESNGGNAVPGKADASKKAK